MKYFIGTALSYQDKWIEISKYEQEALIAAHKNLSNAIFIEESFDIILENFLEYECDLLTTAWKSLVIFETDDDFVKTRGLLTRRIINLLSTGSMFECQSIKHFRAMNFVTSEGKRAFEEYIENIKMNSLAYRFCIKLRNHSLHIDLPVTSIRSKFIREETLSEKDYFQHRIVPEISIKVLNENKDPEMKPIVDELEKLNSEVVDLRPLIREFILDLSKINLQVRVATSARLGENEDLIFKTLKKIGIDIPSKKITLYVIQMNETNKQFTYYPIKMSFLARRKKYIEKNNLPDTFSNLYATNQI